MMDDDSSDEGSQNPLLGFLFGNIGEGNRVDADYLDEDAREHLAGLARVEGIREALEAEVKEDAGEANEATSPQPHPAASFAEGGPHQVRPDADAEDFAGEQELIEEEGPLQGLPQQHLGLVAAALQGSQVAAEEEDYDFDMEELEEERQQAGTADMAPAAAEQAQQPPVQEQHLALSPDEGTLAPADIPAQQALADPQQVAAAAKGLKLPVLGGLEALSGSRRGAVLRFSELFGAATSELGPPGLLPAAERARQRAAQRGRVLFPRAAGAGEEEGAFDEARVAEDLEAGDEGILHADLGMAEYEILSESEEESDGEGVATGPEASPSPASAVGEGGAAGKAANSQQLRSVSGRAKSTVMPPALRHIRPLPLAEVPESLYAGVQQWEWEEGIAWSGDEGERQHGAAYESEHESAGEDAHISLPNPAQPSSDHLDSPVADGGTEAASPLNSFDPDGPNLDAAVDGNLEGGGGTATLEAVVPGVGPDGLQQQADRAVRDGQLQPLAYNAGPAVAAANALGAESHEPHEPALPPLQPPLENGIPAVGFSQDAAREAPDIPFLLDGLGEGVVAAIGQEGLGSIAPVEGGAVQLGGLSEALAAPFGIESSYLDGVDGAAGAEHGDVEEYPTAMEVEGDLQQQGLEGDAVRVEEQAAAVEGGRQGASLVSLSLPVLEELGWTGTRRDQIDDDMDSPTMTRVLIRAPLLRLERVVLETPETFLREGGEEGEEDDGEVGDEKHVPSPKNMLRGVQPADVAWEEGVVWEGASEAAQKLQSVPLWLDLNDPGLTFEYMKKQGGVQLAEQAAAGILPHMFRGLPPVRNQADAQDDAALELARLNVSRDSAYLQQAKKRAGGVAAKVWHAKPAVDLNTIPIHMTQAEMQHFHRPRGSWWPVMVSRLTLALGGRKGKKGGGGDLATVTITTLPGISKTFKTVDPTQNTPHQLWDSLLNLAEFKEAAGRQPLLLLPGRPPRPLALDQTLVEAGIKPGESRVGITAAFTQLELIPTKVAEQIPAESNPALLRAPHAFGRKKDFSAAEGGRFLIAEYLEQGPPLINRPGMGAKLVTYYRKRDATDSDHQKLREEEKWRVGAIHPLGEDDDSPFLGDLQPGSSQLAVETGLFRAPAFPYAPQYSDFLLLRSPCGVMRLREFRGALSVGQELPMLRVPTPNSRDLKDLEEKRMYVYVFKELRRRQMRLEKRGAGERAHVSVRELHQLFPNRPESMIKAYLKDSCDLAQVRGEEEGLYGLKEGARVPTEAELKKKLTPGQACAVEASYVAEFRMKSRGILLHERFSNVAVEKLRLAARMLPHDEATQRAAKYVEHAMQVTPWALTDAFVSYFLDQKANLQMTGPADPTGRGFGYSFIRDIRHKGSTEDVAKALAKKQAGKVQGTDADLRRMTTEQAKQRLLEFGLEEDVITAMGRWQRIDAVREFATATVYDGTNMSTKYARAQKLTYIEQQKKYRARAQEIFDKQVAVLNNSADEHLPEVEEEEDGLAGEVDGAKEAATPQPRSSKKSKRAAAPAQDDEERHLQEMRAAGFMGTPARGGGGAATDTSTQGGDWVARPGERRIRREVLMKQSDGSFVKVQEIVYQGRDTPHMLASLYTQKEGSGGTWGFGMREIKGVPRTIPKLSYGAARGRGMGRGVRGASRGAQMSGRGRARPRVGEEEEGEEEGGPGSGVPSARPPRAKRRTLNDEGEEEESIEELPIKTESEGEPSPAPQPARAKARRPSAAAAVTIDITAEEGGGEVPLDGGAIAEEGGEEEVKQVASQGEVPGASGGWGGGGLASPVRVVKFKLKTAPSGAGAGTGGRKGRARDESPEFETYEEDLIVDEERASDDDFRPESDGGGGGGSEDMDFELGDELFGGEEDDEEAGFMMRARSRSVARAKGAPSPRRRSSTASGARPKRKASILLPPSGNFEGLEELPAEAVPLAMPAAVVFAPANKRPLNQVLGGIVKALKHDKNFKLYFCHQVSTTNVPDYSKFVPHSKAMWLDRMHKRTGAATYTSVADFRRDLGQILECAQLYNAPGCGAYGGPGVIDLAQQLVAASDAELAAREGELVQLEELAQGRTIIQPDPYVASYGGYAAPTTVPAELPRGAVPAAAAAPVEDLWVQCTRCNKWRVLSQQVHKDTVANQPEDAPWYCEMNYDRPNASCEDMDDELAVQQLQTDSR